MSSARPDWTQPPSEQHRETTMAERGEILVDLLLLTDALPPVAHTDLTAPTFRELCERHR